MNVQLGNYLKKLRKSHKYTQEYVASYLNVIRQSYSHYETGRTSPSIETLNQLATLYQIPLDELLSLQLDSAVSKNSDCISLLCISPREFNMLNAFRKLSEQDQQDILDFIQIKAARDKKA